MEEGAEFVPPAMSVEDGKVEKIAAERIVSAVGVQGNIENLGLEALGVKTDRDYVVADGYGRTVRAGPLRHRRRCGSAHACPQGGA